MNGFTLVYIALQFIILLCVCYIFWKIKGWRTYTNTATSILTVFGVLGTFIGIYSGLQDFTTENLQSSIKELLDSLKFAFLTSIVGLGSALLFKGVISPLVGKRQTREDPDPIDEVIDKFVLALKDVETSGESRLSAKLEVLMKAIKNEDSDTGTVLGEVYDIKTALTGETERAIPTQLQNLSKVFPESRLNTIETSLSDKEGNLLTELRALRKDISTKHDELRKEFQQFAENVSKSVTDELIEAFKRVIENFDAKIQEQFGEDFKQLKAVIERTAEWQEQYRQQMDELAEQFRIAARSVQQSSVALASAAQSLITIQERSESLVSVAERLDPILHTLNDQLEAFSELRRKAHEALPLIEARLNSLTTDFSEAVTMAITDSQASMESQRDALKKTNQLVTELTTNFSDTIKTSIAESQASMESQRDALANQVDQLQTTLKGQAQELGNIVERNREDMRNHVDILHSSLRQELNDSVQKLASYLESLSEGFVENYEKVAGIYTQALVPIQELIEVTRQERREEEGSE